MTPVSADTPSPTVSGDFSNLKVSFSSTSGLVGITDFSACLSPICLPAAFLTLCLLTFTFCLSAHPSPMLSLLSLLSGSSQFSSFFFPPPVNSHLFSARDQPIYKSPATFRRRGRVCARAGVLLS